MCQRHLRAGGVLWALKHQQGVLDDVNVHVALRREWTSHSPFLKPTLRTSFEPHRVAIKTTDGHVVEERLQPRDSFGGHRVDTPWDPLHLAYFGGYAMWTHLTTPFLFAVDGVTTEELESWPRGVWALSGPALKIANVPIVPRGAFEKHQAALRDGMRSQMTRIDYDRVAPEGVKAVRAVEQYRGH